MMQFVESIDQLIAIYGKPAEASTAKVTHVVTDDYRRFIEAAPFVALATCGPEGLDCSPRGDIPGFVRIVNATRLLIPDRRGNNRVDSLLNIVRDPRIALLFLVPGCKNTLRLNGTARVSVDAEVLRSFSVDGSEPRSVIDIQVEDVYFQCGRALIRSQLWNPDQHIRDDALPTPGQILANLTDNRVGGEAYDAEWPERARKTLW